MASYLSGFTNPHYYFNAYPLGPVTNYSTIANSLNSLVSQGYNTLDVLATAFGSDESNFDLTERISAAYAMNTIEFGRFRLQTGLRVEATQLNILGFNVQNQLDPITNQPIVTPQPASQWYWDPLPSVQLRYRITDDSDIRAVYARAISRPNPYDMVPYVTVDPTTNPYTVTTGNPNLKPEHANDYDLLYEHYLKPYGEIQAGFFYKQLSAPIYYILNPSIAPGQPYYNIYPGDQLSYITERREREALRRRTGLYPAPGIPARRVERLRHHGKLQQDRFERRNFAAATRRPSAATSDSNHLES
jgi:TonB-dependent receptor